MALVDQKTPRLGLLLPFTDNFLQDDVERLRDTLNLLDVLVVTRDKTTGKIADDMLSDVIAKLDANGKLNKANLPSTVVQTGPDGKIDGSLMPSIAVIDTFPVPNEASMLGLQCERGDIAIREDLGKTFILTQMPPSVLSNWRELTSTNVTSVNGKTGAVTGLAASGANNDITSLNALSGPLRLGGDAVGDYDAVTMRQLRSASGGAGGAGGASMNGVMNYGVGDFHLRDSRAYIQPYEVVSDGQLLNRADWPELWAYAQMLTPIADAEWLADPLKRGRYSLGNGTTTFRVPDRNGVQSGSLAALYGRGDGAGNGYANSIEDGNVFDSAAPNITGYIGGVVSYGAGGAFRYYQSKPSIQDSSEGTGFGIQLANIDASRSSPIYGRSNAEIMGRNFVGVWVIRASGGFVAANTSWSVINGDAVAPANGTLVRGGNIISEYGVAGAKKYSAELLSQAQYGAGKSAAVIRATDHISSQTKDLVFETDGTLTVPGTIISAGVVSGGFLDSTGIGYGGGLRRLAAYAAADAYSVNQVYFVENAGSRTVCYQVTIPGQSYQHVWRMDHDGLNKYFSIRSDNNMYTPLGAVAIQGSDVRIKDNFEEPKEGAWDRVKSIGICEFKYKGQNVTQRGFLAQQMGEIDPVYTFEGGTAHDDDGNEFEIINVNDKAVLADVITVMQMMQDKIEAMESEIAELKASK